MTNTFNVSGPEIARLIHETADLVERGLVVLTAVEIECPDSRVESMDGGAYVYRTGKRIVRLHLLGFDFAVWDGAADPDAQRNLSLSRRALSYDSTRIGAPDEEQS